MNLSKAHIELDRLFDIFNKKYFDSSLQKPMIIIQSTGKKPINGYCTAQQMWKNENGDGLYEMGISAEHLTRTVEDLCGTLIHEMVHLYNLSNGIKDVASNYIYHNKNFKLQAEKRGLIITKAPKVGWSVTSLQDETKEFISSLNVDQTVFSYYRVYYQKPKIINKYPQYKYMCPKCGEKILSRNIDLRLSCDSCSDYSEDEYGTAVSAIFFERVNNE